jgi:hypothetical protein
VRARRKQKRSWLTEVEGSDAVASCSECDQPNVTHVGTLAQVELSYGESFSTQRAEHSVVDSTASCQVLSVGVCVCVCVCVCV